MMWTVVKIGGAIVNSRYHEHEGLMIPNAWWHDRVQAERWAREHGLRAVPIPYVWRNG